MTRDRELERVLDGWLAEGPSTMPDRFFDGLLDRVDRTSQRRLAALLTRFPTMTPITRRLAIAVALAAAIVLIAFAAIGSGSRPTATAAAPTAAASPTTAPSTLVAPATRLSAALTHRWNGPTRTIAGMSPPAVSAAVLLEGLRMRFDAGGAPRPDLVSDAGAVGPNQIQFVLKADQAGCHAGDVGTYTFTLSAGGGFLALQPLTDACAARSTALTGDWERSDCPNAGGWCLGDMEAGRHRSAVFNPFVTFDNWTFDYGRLLYTVPAGWANEQEDRTLYVISQQGRGEDASIWLLSDEGAHRQHASGPETAVDPAVGRTTAALQAWLARVRGLVASTPTPVTIGGLTGVSLDLRLDPRTARTCPGATTPSVQIFGDADGNEHDVHVAGDVPMRVYLLDLGDGRSLVIFVNGVDKATYDALLPDATSIIESFQFNR
jgi:hypothetical protein